MIIPTPQESARLIARLKRTPSCTPDSPHLHLEQETFKLRGHQMSTRRAAWLVLRGTLQESEIVRPTCGVATCIAPEHQEVITREQHLQEQSLRGIRGSMPGDQNPQAVLTEEQCEQIRQEAPLLSRKDLAAKYQISPQQVSRILRGKRSESKEEREAQASKVLKK